MVVRRWLRPVALVTALIIPVACSGASPAPTLTSSPTATATPSPADEVAALADLTVTIDGGPDFPVAAFGSLWLLRPDLTTPVVVRMDPASGSVLAEVPVGNALCQATAATEDAIWACSDDGLIRIDPETNTATGEVTAEIGQYLGYLAVGDGSIWVLGGQGTLTDTLLRIDPGAMQVVDSMPLGFNGGNLAFDFGALWITAPAEGKLVRVDPATGARRDHATGLPWPRWVTTGFGSVWVGLHDSRDERPEAGAPTLARVDPTSGAVQASIAVGPDPLESCLYAGSRGIWVRSGDPFLALFDPATNTVARVVRSRNPQGCVVELDGRLWVISYEFQTIWRFKPGAP